MYSGSAMDVDSDAGRRPQNGPNRRMPPSSRRSEPNVGRPFIRQNQPSEPAGAWKHDLYENGSAAAPRQSEQLVRISNLHWNVTEEDLEELFGAQLKSVKLKYDASGRSEGIADLVFTTREAAEAAVNEYDGRELDQMPMMLRILTPVADRLGPQSAQPPQQRLPAHAGVAVHGGLSGASAAPTIPAAPTASAAKPKKPKKKDVLNRLGKRLEERLGKRFEDRIGKRVEDRLGPRNLSGASVHRGVGSLGRSPGLPRRQRGNASNRNIPAATREHLDAEIDSMMRSATGVQRPIVSYADADQPANANMI